MSAAATIFDRDLLARRRGRVAAGVARHEFLLVRVADDIADRISLVRRSFQSAAVISAHNGVAGRRLRGLGNVGLVVEADPSARMLAACDGPVVLADEEWLPFRDASLDLVVSALSLHLVNDLPGALVQIRRALRPDGLFVGAMLGGRTLAELREALLAAEAEVEGGASPRVAPFVDVREAGGLLQRAGFALPVADSDTVTASYATPIDLMHELKAMGCSNMLAARRRSPLRRATLARACEIYAERFSEASGRCLATFEVLTLTGWAPHEGQQKPLAPGSGRTRLADALGTRELSADDKAGR